MGPGPGWSARSSEHRAGVLLPHAESGGSVFLRREGIGAHPLEETKRHAARPHHPLPGNELRHLDREGTPWIDFDVDLDRLARRDTTFDPLHPRVPRGIPATVGEDRPDH